MEFLGLENLTIEKSIQVAYAPVYCTNCFMP